MTENLPATVHTSPQTFCPSLLGCIFSPLLCFVQPYVPLQLFHELHFSSFRTFIILKKHTCKSHVNCDYFKDTCCCNDFLYLIDEEGKLLIKKFYTPSSGWPFAKQCFQPDQQLYTASAMNSFPFKNAKGGKPTRNGVLNLISAHHSEKADLQSLFLSSSCSSFITFSLLSFAFCFLNFSFSKLSCSSFHFSNTCNV